MTLKPSAPIAQKLQSATPSPTNVLVGRRSNPRPASSGIPAFPLLPPLRPRGAAPFTQAAARAQPSDGRIAFVSDRDGNAEIYAMNADGSDLVRLANNFADDRIPSWGPAAAPASAPTPTNTPATGGRIAFVSGRDDNPEICVMNADGSGLARLANNPDWDSDPSWSPDGRRIAFASHRDGNDEIYAMNADGSGAARLAN